MPLDTGTKGTRTTLEASEVVSTTFALTPFQALPLRDERAASLPILVAPIEVEIGVIQDVGTHFQPGTPGIASVELAFVTAGAVSPIATLRTVMHCKKMEGNGLHSLLKGRLRE